MFVASTMYFVWDTKSDLPTTWVEKRDTLEASRAEASSKTNGLALELVQAKAYI